MRGWVRSHPINTSRLQDGSAAKAILSKEPMLEPDFSPHPDANPKSRIQGLVRWQLNPDKDWGPKSRAARAGKADTVLDRRSKGELRAEKRRSKRKADVSVYRGQFERCG
jgi:tRNA (guanine26-N2/guanine27-N2)-dimethyltransferase